MVCEVSPIFIRHAVFAFKASFLLKDAGDMAPVKATRKEKEKITQRLETPFIRS
jgi:hypothetical protein